MKDKRLLALIDMWEAFRTEGKGDFSKGILKAIGDTINYLLELKLIKEQGGKE